MLSYPPDMAEKANAAMQGNGQAAGYLFDWFRAPLLAHALRVCGNTPLAQDALQETFITAYTKLSTLRDSTSFYPWLRSILLRKCYRMVKRDSGQSGTSQFLHDDVAIHEAADARLEKSAISFQLYETLQGLSEELRSCVMLRYFSELNSYEEIALLLSIPIGTVRSRLAAAREKMKLLYAKSEDAAGTAWNAAQEWSSRYSYWWGDMYDDLNARTHLLEHLHPELIIRFTSGKVSYDGHNTVVNEVEGDLRCGTFFRLHQVHSCGDISIIEGPNVNSPEYPDRCAPSTVFVAFRQKGFVTRLHVFDAPRKLLS